MIVLAIDTSNQPLSLAVVKDDAVMGELTLNIKRNHSIQAMTAVESLLATLDLSADQIERIVVAKGPGSYTGVRIGVTLAKTLAWSLKIPLVGVSSLLSLSWPGKQFDGIVSPIMNARRGRVYTGLYTFDETWVELEEDRNLSMEEWLDLLADREEAVLFCGADVDVFWEQIQARLGDRAKRVSESEEVPRMAEMAIYASELADEDVHEFVPNYIRMAEAEVNWLKEQEKNNG
ncbi:tRNA (adenosine(37)-N6)-threonylcarbamoyltransferase complex dimerization subunit type 1 TsaB [Jeotgalibacillus sp. R-1-5s-1]|uniref:tRNA (adenosine(37)-N6)-threonylcarbamoyltransferase complex dimerization subunit type 1 TsaB n=1 Tax=Jeotgalibacillus sp. R-1-5s-1 TaxID=2555897 RepID=UPI00106BBE4C|nr:tRNA (adenosine(37)-N6)-threonylcarbamoyltransferase complex dimerization subunit type 1 TsaB [Jeotgalibacillus sp. R-1-5s-1]TFD93689.1 tRNA (adenosine(37)-N6)-threonylcarbamoyltransferase complex dimerization subunit type 1 TsaB [Jeotgalibacillus sp. R-1-5s-1]